MLNCSFGQFVFKTLAVIQDRSIAAHQEFIAIVTAVTLHLEFWRQAVAVLHASLEEKMALILVQIVRSREKKKKARPIIYHFLTDGGIKITYIEYGVFRFGWLETSIKRPHY